jgi:hypothetical protein
MTNRTEQPSRGRASRVVPFVVFALVALCLPGAASAQWATNGDNITNTNTGNVGVGTAAPSAKLHIAVPATGYDPQFKLEGTVDPGNGATRLTLINPRAHMGISTYGSASPGVLANAGGLFAGVPSSALVIGTGANIPLHMFTNDSYFAPHLTLDTRGNLGVGTTTPGRRLEVLAPDGEAARLYRNGNGLNWGVNIKFALNNSANGLVDYAGLHGQISNPVSGAEGGNLLFTTATVGQLTEKMRLDSAGNLGIGTTAPTSKLTIYDARNTAAGQRIGIGYNPSYNYTVGRNPNTGYLEFIGTNVTSSQYIGYTFNGGVNVTGDITVTGNINAKYQDVAEWVPSAQKLAAGTVVILDPERPNHVLASKGSYDTAVAGVISEKPGLSLGEAGEGKALVATTGRVKVRVDATYAPIRIGDLLVTSDVAGVAMKSEPIQVGGRQIHAPGTIIGKALEPLVGGTGEILVLLSLQ